MSKRSPELLVEIRILDLNPSTLHGRIRKLGIQRP